MVKIVASSERRTEYPVRQTGYYAPIRCTEGREWISSSELGADREHAAKLELQTNRHCGPEWSKVNPVVRFARVAIVEISEES